MRLEDAIKQAVRLGLQTGTISFAQLNKLLPSGVTKPEDIETVMLALSENQIAIIDQS